MSDRRRGMAAPFYAAPRRTSAEIISEARAAIRGEMTSPSSGSSLGAVRPLRTRRPFTPREPQRTLFNERSKKKDARPPSSFDLKYLPLTEEEALVTSGARIAGLDEDDLTIIGERNSAKNRKALNRSKVSPPEKLSNEWSGFPKLPHLSGKSKPLHRRNTTANSIDSETDLSHAISITKPIGQSSGDGSFASGFLTAKVLSPDIKKSHYGTKSLSYDGALGDVGVKQIAVQMPKTSHDNFYSMTLLELSEALSQKCDANRTRVLFQALQNKIEISSPTGSLRDLVLRSLYTHIDSDDEVLVAIARAMLTMRVTGPHLAAACKMVFKIARNDKNDHFFKNSNLLELVVEGCGRAEPISESECCVYAAGALRFLALEPTLCALAHRAGALHLAALHLKILNNAKTERPRQVSEQAVHALYQVTGALRNLANANEYSPSFVSSGALAELLAALQLHTDRDVLTNVARCLSVLSAEESCCAWLCACTWSSRALLSALAACSPRAPLAVRLAYTLGNMAAADEQASINIYNEENSLDVLLTILESYTKRTEGDAKELNTDPDLHLVGSDLGGSDGSNEDVLIKTVRVIANLCLSEAVGKSIAATHSERTIRALLACLDVAEKSIDNQVHNAESDHPNRRDELAMAALATLNNVTFYLDPAPAPRRLDDTLDLLCKATCRWAQRDGVASCEAVRALGNLSRSARAAQVLVLEGAIDLLPRFSVHEEASVRFAAAGLLVNVCGAGCNTSEGAKTAAHALTAAAEMADAPTAALLARALWNAHAHAPLLPECAREAADALATFIDDDSIFSICEVSRKSDSNKQHVKFAAEQGDNVSNQNGNENDHQFQNSSDEEADRTGCSGEDLGFEEGEVEECECDPCSRLAAWEELVGVAIPLLEKLRPPRADASVGTD
ncbi:armadillo repeat-containing protein 2 [Pieris napi]|uniref:armadillo repeat-containing protein 2 n=1 Tax=Pieris napi TaxID=78633 RepID=UPI001FB92E5F|nr:armadillo repeat-containing protein 2 [Pieris napi]XP_047510929.1 armadillo repeat-containing protein 2 [Pieris napi]XP_047510930.1 armadillo repeat-containing protein 2 [Pieris napi]